MNASIERRHFEAFVAVAEELHFGAAAKRLHLSQPAVTQTIKSLEASLGVTLLDRSRRAVYLTAAGRDFLARARDVLSRMQDSVSSAQAAAIGHRGELRIAFTGAFSLGPLPGLLAQYRKRWPGVDLQLSQISTADQLEGLATGRIDLGSTFLPPTAPEGLGVRLYPFGGQPLVAVLPRDHPLARGGALAIESLHGETLLTLSHHREPALRPLAAFVANRSDSCPPTTQPSSQPATQEVDQLDTLLSLVARGFGVSLLPASVRQFEVEGVCFAEIRPRVEVPMCLMCPESSSQPTLAPLLEIIEGGPIETHQTR